MKEIKPVVVPKYEKKENKATCHANKGIKPVVML